MATIANLAIKIQANIGNLVDKFNEVSGNINTMSKIISSTSPNVKTLRDSFLALSAVQDVVKNSVNLTSEQLAELQKNVDNVAHAVQSNAEKAAAGISQMTPSVEGFRKACEQFNALQELAEQMREVTGDSQALNGVLETAREGLAQLAVSINQVNLTNLAFNAATALNALPLLLISGTLKDIYQWAKELWSYVDNASGGWLGTSVKVITTLTVILGLIGYCTTATISWSAVTAFLQGLFRSNIVIVGLTTVVSMLWAGATATAAWLVAQLGLNTAWTYFLASTGIGLILVAIGGIVYGIMKLVQWLSSGKSAAEQMKDEIKAMEDQTAAFRDKIGESIDRYRELNNLARKYHEDNLTGLQKYENKLKEIDEVLNRQNVAESAMSQLDAKQNELQTALDKATSAGETERMESLQKQIDKIVEDKAALQKERDQSPAMSAADAAAAKEKERVALLQGRFGDLLEQTLTPQQEYAKTIFDLALLTQKGLVTEAEQQLITANALKKRNEAMIGSLGIGELIETPETAQNIYDKNIANLQTALESGVITQEQYNTGMANALKRFNETDTATLEAKKQAGGFAAAQQKLVDKFKGMETLSPVAAFESLSAELQSVRDKLKPEELADAQQKLLNDLAGGLGIADFVNPKQSDTLESVQQKVLDYYNQLDGLGKATFDLAAAQRRVTESFEKQSEYYNLYRKAQDALIPAQQKLTDAFKRIEEEAGKWGWTDEIVAKMKEMTEDEIIGKEEGKEQNTPKPDHSKNAALELGTVAYYEAQKKGNDPILKENQKQTKTLETIARNTATNSETNNVQLILIS
jgi:ABC-type transporter Mla subunit MlaD